MLLTFLCYTQIRERMAAMQEAMKKPEVQKQMAEMQAAMQNQALQERMAQLKALPSFPSGCHCACCIGLFSSYSS